MSTGLRGIFSKISFAYEVFNRLITLGLDTVWRRKAAQIASRYGGSIWLDLCCGTGNMAATLQRDARLPGFCIAIDYSVEMLSRASEKSDLSDFSFMLADAKALPFRANTIELATIAFATRNLSITPESLRQSMGEIHRILQPNGWFLSLETSQPRNSIINRLFKLYIHIVLGKLTSQIPTLHAASKYLEYSIIRFYDPETFGRILETIGFSNIVYSLLSFGAVAIHQMKKNRSLEAIELL